EGRRQPRLRAGGDAQAGADHGLADPDGGRRGRRRSADDDRRGLPRAGGERPENRTAERDSGSSQDPVDQVRRYMLDKIVLVVRKTRLEGLIERLNSRAPAKFYLDRSG